MANSQFMRVKLDTDGSDATRLAVKRLQRSVVRASKLASSNAATPSGLLACRPREQARVR